MSETDAKSILPLHIIRHIMNVPMTLRESSKKRSTASIPSTKSIQSILFARSDYLAAATSALIALIVYLITLAPTITGDDSGEFVTAAYTLGIPHPPGYPLYCMLGKLFTLIVPFGTIAARVAFMSAFFGAATCFVLTLIIIRLTANRPAAMAASVAFAVSLEFWKWNVVAETYSLNAFLMLTCMLILLKWQDVPKNKYLYWFAFVYGLGLTNHHTTHFLGPVFAAFIIVRDFNDIRDCKDRKKALPPARTSVRGVSEATASGEDRGGGWRHLRTYALMLAIAAAVWTLIHLYLPIRAMADPYVNFSDPRTWERFWGVVTRKPFTQGLVEEPRTLARFLEQCWLFLTQYGRQYTPFLAPLPLFGIYPLWKRNRGAALLVVGTFLYVALGLILVINTGFDRSDMWFNSKFWVPAYAMAAILMGAALAWVATFKIPRYVAPALGVVVFVVPLMANYRTCDKSDYYYAYDYARNLADTLEPDAYLLSSADYAHFGIYYLQAVENYRTDITVVNKYGYINEDINAQLPADLQNTSGPWVAPSSTEIIDISKWIRTTKGRPVYHTAGISNAAYHGVKMVNRGIVQQMLFADEPATERDYWSTYTWRNSRGGIRPPDPASDSTDNIPDDFTAENIVAEYHFARARDLMACDEREQAARELECAISIADRHIPLLNNYGIYSGENGLIELAERCFRGVLDSDPRDQKALRNLGVVLGMKQDYAGARDAFQRLVDVHESKHGPDHFVVAGSLTNLGSAHLALGDFQAAKKSFTRAYKIDKSALGEAHPFTARDMSNLAVALNALGDTAAAQKYQTQAVEILKATVGPTHPLTQSAQQGAFIESMEQ